MAVSAEVVRTYWHIGERIVREEQGATRSAYGEGGLARLGAILSREFGRGFAERSLQNMRQFFLAYPNASTLRTELGWSHYRTLMRLSDEQRAFYERVAAASRWSSRELDKQINSMLYERTALSRQPGTLLGALPTGETPLAPLLLAGSDRPAEERIKIAHYLLLNSEEAIKQRLAEISAAYDEVRRTTESRDT